MKLQTKFIVILLGAILPAFVGSQVFQEGLGRKALNKLGGENLGLLEERERGQAENIFQTADPIVQSTINQGDDAG